jgi:hypothetical protein
MYLVSGHVQRGDNCELTINDYCEGDYAFDIACDDNTKTASNYQKVRKAKCDVCVRGKCQSQVEFVVGEEFILIDDICATHPSACKKTKTVKDLITETGTDDHIEDMGPGVDALKFGSN